MDWKSRKIAGYHNVDVGMIEMCMSEKRDIDIYAYLCLTFVTAGYGWISKKDAYQFLSYCSGKTEATSRRWVRDLRKRGWITTSKKNIQIVSRAKIMGDNRYKKEKLEFEWLVNGLNEFKARVAEIWIIKKQKTLRHFAKKKMRNTPIHDQSHLSKGLKLASGHVLRPEEVGVAVSLISRGLGVSVGKVCGMKKRLDSKKVFKPLTFDEPMGFQDFKNWMRMCPEDSRVVRAFIDHKNDTVSLFLEYPSTYQLRNTKDYFK